MKKKVILCLASAGVSAMAIGVVKLIKHARAKKEFLDEVEEGNTSEKFDLEEEKE